MKPINIINKLNEGEDWENSNEWKDKDVIAHMPKFKSGTERILNELYGGGYVTYPHYLKATLHFSSYAEDEEYTTPEQYSTLKKKILDCASKNNFTVDEKSFFVEVDGSSDFDQDLGFWNVDFNFTLSNRK